MKTIQFENIGQLVTLAPLATEHRTIDIEYADLGIVKNAWLRIQDGLVHSYGEMAHCPYAEEIRDLGGGIRSTMAATRGSSQLELEALTLSRLQQFLRSGTTTVEVKSGYGLSVESELLQLEVLQAVKDKTPQTLRITCLALH